MRPPYTSKLFDGAHERASRTISEIKRHLYEEKNTQKSQELHRIHAPESRCDHKLKFQVKVQCYFSFQ